LINYLARLKVPVELLFCGFFLLAYGATKQQFFLLLIVLVGIGVSAVLTFGRSINLAIFLLPNLDVFTQTSYISSSLATFIFLAMFARYALTQLAHTNYYRPGLIITLLVIVFELLHLIYNPVMFSTKTIRWLLLFLFVSLIIFDWILS